MGCVLAREVWAACLGWWNKRHWMPEHDSKFVAWLQDKQGGEGRERDLWTGIALVCWTLWRHRNDVVFEGATPSPGEVIRKITAEADLWRTARLFRDCLGQVDR
uniref:Uncharacterized protein n=1 Tax=Avena sativa TaxID=4498 RepID=A0ACD5W8X6_AVESA